MEGEKEGAVERAVEGNAVGKLVGVLEGGFVGLIDGIGVTLNNGDDGDGAGDTLGDVEEAGLDETDGEDGLGDWELTHHQFVLGEEGDPPDGLNDELGCGVTLKSGELPEGDALGTLLLGDKLLTGERAPPLGAPVELEGETVGNPEGA